MKTFAMVIADDKNEFKRLFGLSANDFMDSMMTVFTKKLQIDIIKLEDWLVANKGYDIDKDGSLSDFIVKTYGKEANDFLDKLLKGYKPLHG